MPVGIRTKRKLQYNVTLDMKALTEMARACVEEEHGPRCLSVRVSTFCSIKIKGKKVGSLYIVKCKLKQNDIICKQIKITTNKY